MVIDMEAGSWDYYLFNRGWDHAILKWIVYVVHCSLKKWFFSVMYTQNKLN